MGAQAIALDVARGAVVLEHGRRVEADAIELATPPSTWSKLTLDRPWPHATVLQMGLATKGAVTFREPLAPGAYSTLNFAPGRTLWESWGVPMQSHANRTAALMGFFTAHASSPAAGTAFRHMAAQFGPLTPHASWSVFEWQQEPHVLGGYAFPAPGEVTTWGPTLNQSFGRLYFAGDCTRYAHIGYMEGAIRSGEAAAERILHAAG